MNGLYDAIFQGVWSVLCTTVVYLPPLEVMQRQSGTIDLIKSPINSVYLVPVIHGQIYLPNPHVVIVGRG